MLSSSCNAINFSRSSVISRYVRDPTRSLTIPRFGAFSVRCRMNMSCMVGIFCVVLVPVEGGPDDEAARTPKLRFSLNVKHILFGNGLGGSGS